MITEINTNELMFPAKIEYSCNRVLIISQHDSEISLSKQEAIELRDFLNQLDLNKTEEK